MLGPVREFARTLLSFALTRSRLAATELEEQALRLIEILAWLAVALFFLGVALLFGAVLVVLVFWDSNRVLAAGLLAALFVAAGAGAVLIARLRLRERPKFLAATLAELERDRDTLGRP
ncbi:MAG TPA: phage holin family protein [Burkholderiales bacterium]|nr:phage holin family protein [Burkholderiales bacterium]